MAANVLDGLIGVVIWGIVLAIFIAIGAAMLSSADTPESGLGVVLGGYLLFVLVTTVGAFLFHAWQLCRRGEHNGQTFGKQALGIRIVRADGRPVNFGTFLMRHFMFGLIASVIFFGGAIVLDPNVAAVALILGMLADYLWPLADERNQTLHDKFARTFVVPTRSAAPPVTPAPPPIMPPPARRLHRDDDF